MGVSWKEQKFGNRGKVKWVQTVIKAVLLLKTNTKKTCSVGHDELIQSTQLLEKSSTLSSMHVSVLSQKLAQQLQYTFLL